MAWLAAVTDLGPQTFALHQPTHPVAIAPLAGFAQIAGDFAMPVHAAAGQPEVLDASQQARVLARSCTGLLAPPPVIATAMHAEHPAHRTQTKFAGMCLHEHVLRFYPLAKYAAAFLRMSRSSVTRLSSAFRRRTSAL